MLIALGVVLVSYVIYNVRQTMGTEDDRTTDDVSVAARHVIHLNTAYLLAGIMSIHNQLLATGSHG